MHPFINIKVKKKKNRALFKRHLLTETLVLWTLVSDTVRLLCHPIFFRSARGLLNTHFINNQKWILCTALSSAIRYLKYIWAIFQKVLSNWHRKKEGVEAEKGDEKEEEGTCETGLKCTQFPCKRNWVSPETCAA